MNLLNNLTLMLLKRQRYVPLNRLCPFGVTVQAQHKLNNSRWPVMSNIHFTVKE